MGTGPAHCGGVDDRGHYWEVVHQQAIVQSLVPVVDIVQDHPLPDIVRVHPAVDDLVLRLQGGPQCPALVELPHHVLLLVLNVEAAKWNLIIFSFRLDKTWCGIFKDLFLHLRRQKTSDGKSVPFSSREAKTLVENGI